MAGAGSGEEEQPKGEGGEEMQPDPGGLVGHCKDFSFCYKMRALGGF